MRDAGDNMNACETSKIRAEGSTFSRRSFEVFGRFENSHGRFEMFGRFEVSKTGHFATGHFTHHAKSDTSHFRWREIGHFEHTFEIGHFEHGARHSLRVSGAAQRAELRQRAFHLDSENQYKLNRF